MRKTGKMPAEVKVTKREIGKVGNLTFYDASVEKVPDIPTENQAKRQRNNDGLRKKKTAPKKAENNLQSRQQQALEKSKERIQTAREQREKIMNPKFKKIKDPLPNYKGPYNKELIQSDIALVDLIDNDTHRRLKKLGKKQKTESSKFQTQPTNQLKT